MPYFVFGITTCGYFFRKINTVEYTFLLSITWVCCYALKLPTLEPMIAIITSLLICKVNFNSYVSIFFGKISYSVYLLHAVVGLKFLNFMGRYVHNPWHTWLFFILGFLLTIFCSYIFYLLVEKPSIFLWQERLFMLIKMESRKFKLFENFNLIRHYSCLIFKVKNFIKQNRK